MATYGYGRVSREEQTTENQKQVLELQQKMIIDQWFEDQSISGKTKAKDRPEFSKMFAKAVAGDQIVFTRVDRIGRRAADILTVVEEILEKGVEVFILQIGKSGLSTPEGKMMLGIFAIFAENERLSIVERTLDGLDRTRRAGTIFGRPLSISPETLSTLCDKRNKGITLKALSEEYDLDQMTIQRNVKKWNGKMIEYDTLYNKQQTQVKINSLKEKKQ